jgi:hypothetical protein
MNCDYHYKLYKFILSKQIKTRTDSYCVPSGCDTIHSANYKPVVQLHILFVHRINANGTRGKASVFYSEISYWLAKMHVVEPQWIVTCIATAVTSAALKTKFGTRTFFYTICNNRSTRFDPLPRTELHGSKPSHRNVCEIFRCISYLSGG